MQEKALYFKQYHVHNLKLPNIHSLHWNHTLV